MTTHTTTTPACPACGAGTTTVREHLYGPAGLVRCSGCGTEVLHPQPSDERLTEIYGEDYYAPWGLDADGSVEAMKRATFEWILDRHPVAPGAPVLDLGCATGFLLSLAGERGYRAHGVDLNAMAIERCRAKLPDAVVHCGTLADRPFGDTQFAAIYMIDFIEHVRDPRHELELVRSRLADGGVAVISCPRLDSLSRKVMGLSWSQYREEHITYFTQSGLHTLLEKCGLEVVSSHRTRKVMTLGYLYRQLQTYRHRVLTPVSSALWTALPFMRERLVPTTMGEMTIVASRG